MSHLRIFKYDTPTAVLHARLTITTKPSVFLAGPTVRGNQPYLTSWRVEAIEEFTQQGFDGDLIVPEFPNKEESDKGKRWIPEWEHTGLKLSTVIMFWVPRTRELIGLTTNHELGYWMARDRDKIVYGRPDNAYRIEYNDLMLAIDCQERGLHMHPIHSDLASTVREAIALACSFRGSFSSSEIMLEKDKT